MTEPAIPLPNGEPNPEGEPDAIPVPKPEPTPISQDPSVYLEMVKNLYEDGDWKVELMPDEKYQQKFDRETRDITYQDENDRTQKSMREFSDAHNFEKLIGDIEKDGLSVVPEKRNDRLFVTIHIKDIDDSIKTFTFSREIKKDEPYNNQSYWNEIMEEVDDEDDAVAKPQSPKDVTINLNPIFQPNSLPKDGAVNKDESAWDKFWDGLFKNEREQEAANQPVNIFSLFIPEKNLTAETASPRTIVETAPVATGLEAWFTPAGIKAAQKDQSPVRGVLPKLETKNEPSHTGPDIFPNNARQSHTLNIENARQRVEINQKFDDDSNNNIDDRATLKPQTPIITIRKAERVTVPFSNHKNLEVKSPTFEKVSQISPIKSQRPEKAPKQLGTKVLEIKPKALALKKERAIHRASKFVKDEKPVSGPRIEKVLPKQVISPANRTQEIKLNKNSAPINIRQTDKGLVIKPSDKAKTITKNPEQGVLADKISTITELKYRQPSQKPAIAKKETAATDTSREFTAKGKESVEQNIIIEDDGIFEQSSMQTQVLTRPETVITKDAKISTAAELPAQIIISAQEQPALIAQITERPSELQVELQVLQAVIRPENQQTVTITSQRQEKVVAVQISPPAETMDISIKQETKSEAAIEVTNTRLGAQLVETKELAVPKAQMEFHQPVIKNELTASPAKQGPVEFNVIKALERVVNKTNVKEVAKTTVSQTGEAPQQIRVENFEQFTDFTEEVLEKADVERTSLESRPTLEMAVELPKAITNFSIIKQPAAIEAKQQPIAGESEVVVNPTMDLRLELATLARVVEKLPEQKTQAPQKQTEVKLTQKITISPSQKSGHAERFNTFTEKNNVAITLQALENFGTQNKPAISKTAELPTVAYGYAQIKALAEHKVESGKQNNHTAELEVASLINPETANVVATSNNKESTIELAGIQISKNNNIAAQDRKKKIVELPAERPLKLQRSKKHLAAIPNTGYEDQDQQTNYQAPANWITMAA